MAWNWQHKDWPNFIYEAEEYSHYEAQFLQKAGTMAGSIRHVSEEDKTTLRIALLSDEALKTSEIEGELLDRNAVQSSVMKQFGLQTDGRKVQAAEQGIAEMLVSVYQNYTAPLSHQTLFVWHQQVAKGRQDLQNIGNYRSHAEPMRIVSGVVYDPKVHFEAPPSSQINEEMQQFITWFNDSEKQLPALIRAAIAHVYFESVHPFEDGNGRIGRAISEKALSQSLGQPTLIAIATLIEKTRADYYAALQAVNKGLDISPWLHYFCQLVLDAQDYTQSKIDFLINKAKFYQRFANQLNARQAKVIERVFREGVEGFTGGLSAKKYIGLTGTTRATATRDLQQLVEMGALVKTGELKHTRYYLGSY